MSDKFEKLLDLLVNEQKEDAEKLFHDIVVEKSREIYEGILADDDKSEDVAETEKSSDKAEGDEVAETKDESEDSKEDKVDEASKDESKDEEVKEESKEEVDEETVEEIGGDQTDDLISDIEAEGHGMEPEMGDDNGDEEGEEEASDEVEAKFDPLEKELDALKAEFAKMMDDEKDESIEPEMAPTEEPAEATEETVEAKDETEEAVEEATEKKDADTLIREYSEQMKADMADHAENKKSPMASGKKASTEAKAVKMDQGGEGKGGVGKALTGDTAKDMNVAAKNAPGIKSAKMDNAPKADEADHADNKTTPVAKK